MLRMRTEVESGTVGWGGQEFPIHDGIVEVPPEAAEDLRSHGFEPVPGDTPDPEAQVVNLAPVTPHSVKPRKVKKV
jgi:hypothetical protein